MAAVACAPAVESRPKVRGRILEFLADQHDAVTAKEVALGVGFPKRRVALLLRDLHFEGLVLRVHEGTATVTDPSLWVGM